MNKIYKILFVSSLDFKVPFVQILYMTYMFAYVCPIEKDEWKKRNKKMQK